LFAAVGVLVAASLAWLVWTIVAHSTPTVHSDMVSYEVHGQHEARATFTVVRNSRDVTANCLLRASANDHSVVGELNVRVGPSDSATVTLQRSMRTEREATTVELVGCTAPGQRAPQ
jgi:hypothetical protein